MSMHGTSYYLVALDIYHTQWNGYITTIHTAIYFFTVEDIIYGRPTYKLRDKL